MSRRRGFTLIELLVVILILAILMAVALPLYLRAVRDSQRQTCRSNMQTIANALQAHRVRSTNHLYPGQTTALDNAIDLADPLFVGGTTDLAALPRCPTDSGASTTDDYGATSDVNGQLTISCASDNATELAFHNQPTGGFHPGLDAQ
jgi:type IV pilus assembly protein PilA